MTVVTEIDYEVVTPPSIGDSCDIDGDGMVDDGFIIDCSFACVSDAFLGDAWCDHGFPNFNCAEFDGDEGACECEEEDICMDDNACNFGEEGGCNYPEECYDCDGNNDCSLYCLCS